MDILWVVLTFTFITLCEGGNILYLPFPLHSHIQTGTWLRDDLERYGHTLWIALPETLESRDIIDEKSSHFIKYQSLDTKSIHEAVTVPQMEYYLDYGEYIKRFPDNYNTISGKLMDTLFDITLPGKEPGYIRNRIRDISRTITNDKHLLEVIKQKEFDLLLVDGMLGYHGVLAKLGIPICVLTEDIDTWMSGNLVNPSYMSIAGSTFTDNMDLFQRVYNTMLYGFRMLDTVINTNTEDNSQTSTDSVSRAKLWLVLQDTLVDYPRPAMPHTKYIGGLSLRQPEPITEEFKQFYTTASNGVIVVSIEEGIETLRTPLVEKLFNAFKNTNYSFVISLNVTSLDSSKFLTSRWIPRNDLLANPKTRLFITSCDISGQYESLSHGVPMVGMPVTKDKIYFAKRLQEKGYGVHVDILESTPSDISQKIQKVIETPVYKANTVKAARILKDRLWSTRQEAAYWIAHVIKYSDSHFRSVGNELPWYKYLCVDVTVIFFTIIFLVAWSTPVFLKWSLPGFFRERNSHKTKYE